MLADVDLEAVVCGKNTGLLADCGIVGVDFALVVIGSGGGAVVDGDDAYVCFNCIQFNTCNLWSSLIIMGIRD